MDRTFVLHARGFPAIAVRFKADVCLLFIDDAITTTREALGDEHVALSLGWVIVSYRLLMLSTKVIGTLETGQEIDPLHMINIVWY